MRVEGEVRIHSPLLLIAESFQVLEKAWPFRHRSTSFGWLTFRGHPTVFRLGILVLAGGQKLIITSKREKTQLSVCTVRAT